MALSEEKARRLVEVARMYYEQDMSQQEIARAMEISRPLVSRMLGEARENGIVHIEIRSPGQQENILWRELQIRYGLRGGVCVPRGQHDSLTNQQLAERCVELLLRQKARRFGVGWGTIIGETVSVVEQGPPLQDTISTICPLVGNVGMSTRNYHSDENVRILAQQLGAEPRYLYAPAFAETAQEQELLQKLPYYKAVSREWGRLDMALVNIGNYPSVPDFACASRYGNLLVQGKAVGRLLAYYFDRDGRIFESDTDYATQIPLETLRRCRNVIGICSANTTEAALRGALATGLLHQVAATEELLEAVLK